MTTPLVGPARADAEEKLRASAHLDAPDPWRENRIPPPRANVPYICNTLSWRAGAGFNSGLFR